MGFDFLIIVQEKFVLFSIHFIEQKNARLIKESGIFNSRKRVLFFDYFVSK